MLQQLFALDTYFLISQVLMAIAIVTDFLSFHVKKRRNVLLLLTVSSALIMTHYFLLGKTNAGILLAFSAISFLISSFSHDKRWMYLFLVLYTIPIVVNFTEIWDIIIMFVMYIMIIAKFQKNDKYIRLMIMFGTLFSITYNFIIFTPMGVLLELLFLSSNILGYWRHYIRKKAVNINI